MRILLLNDDYFLDSLKNTFQCDVFFVSAAPEADLNVGLRPVDIHEALAACPFHPDLILISDAINLRAAVKGLDEVTIPVVFYGIDAPMNVFWQRDYALACDLTFLDQKAQVERLRSEFPEYGDRIHWLPLAADPEIYHPRSSEKLYDVAFVGTLSHQQRPKRTWILRTLQDHFDIRIFDGGGNRSIPAAEVAAIYHQSKIVLNENLFPGLNLRAFEVMACGACLLTEESDGSWREFFEDGQHLVTYRPENLCDRVQTLLENDAERERIASAGMNLVHAEHTIAKRAEQMLAVLDEHLSTASPTGKSRSFHLGKAMLELANRWQEQPVAALQSEGLRLLMTSADHDAPPAQLHYELAIQALREERLQDARRSLERALDLDPAHLRSYWAAFWCYRELQEHDAAALAIGRLFHHFQMERTLYPLQTRVTKGLDLEANDYLLLGHLLTKAGWMLDPGIDRSIGHPSCWNAFDVYQKAIELNPKSADAYIGCAAILDDAGIPEFAVFFAEQAVRLRPWDSTLNIKCAELLLQSHRRAEGLERIIHYLVTFSDADKWDVIETLSLNEEERRKLLVRVWDSCRLAEDVAEDNVYQSKTLKRVLKNILRLDPDFESRLS